MKKLTTLILFLAVTQICFGQLDNATKNKIKVMYLSADNFYKSNEYSKTLNEIDKIESLSNGLKLATAQNLKVKSLIGLNRFKEAQKELNVLYNLNPSSEILADIAQYSSKIDAAIKAEQIVINKKREADRIAQMELIEVQRLAKEKAIKEGELANQREFEKKNDQQSWNEALRTNTLESYNSFLQTAKYDEYISEAKKYMKFGTVKKLIIISESSSYDNLNYISLNELAQIKYYINLEEITNINGSQKITQLPEEIGTLKKLNKIELRYHKLSSLPKSFGELSNLKTLKIYRGYYLKEFPNSITKLKNLEVLDLSENKIENLPTSIRYLTSLLELNISSNNIRTIPSAIGDLKRLEILNMSSNEISQLPPEISKLSQLKELDLAINPIKFIPIAVTELIQLEVLNISYLSSLYILPESIGNLIKLESLSINNTLIKQLPESIGHLKNLKSLSLGNSNITSLPTSFCALKNITYLVIEYCEFDDSINCIRDLPKLERIVIDENSKNTAVLKVIKKIKKKNPLIEIIYW